MKHKIPELSDAYFKMQKKLYNGYPTQRDRLYSWFFYGQADPNVKIVVAVGGSPTTRMLNETPVSKKDKTESARLFYGPTSIIIIYRNSNRRLKARVRYSGNKCLIEPVKPNRAFLLLERKYLDNFDVVDLNVIPYERVIHSKRGREFASKFI